MQKKWTWAECKHQLLSGTIRRLRLINLIFQAEKRCITFFLSLSALMKTFSKAARSFCRSLTHPVSLVSSHSLLTGVERSRPRGMWDLADIWQICVLPIGHVSTSSRQCEPFILIFYSSNTFFFIFNRFRVFLVALLKLLYN